MNEVVGAVFVFVIMVAIVSAIFVLSKNQIYEKIDEHRALRLRNAMEQLSDAITSMSNGSRIVMPIYLPADMKEESGNAIVMESPEFKSPITYASGNVVMTTYDLMNCSVQSIGGTPYIIMDNGILKAEIYHYPAAVPFDSSHIFRSLSIQGNEHAVYGFDVKFGGSEPDNISTSLFSSPLMCRARLNFTTAYLDVYLYPGSDRLYVEAVS